MTPSFADLGVPQPLVRALDARGITAPFPIQAATIPDGLAGRDLCGKAATGSGKTIAFGIPMVLRVKRAAPKRPKGLVLAPTRELALQVADELRAIGGDLRVLAVYGGAGIEPQLKALRNGVDIVVACPGRLLDVIDRKACDLRDVSFVVIDEADRMADMGFLPDVRRILDQTAPDRQTVLFSATLDGAVDALVRDYQVDPVVHEMPEEEGGDVAHHFWLVERPERLQLAAEVIERAGPTVVFSRTRHGADRIARQLEKLGVSAAAIHGSRSQGQRERALNQFHEGRVKALVATDVAARGIHVEGVTCVIHFDLPADHKDYVHRSGRTGRAGASGVVVALLGAAQRKDATKLLRDAEVDARITGPDVASLPAGHAAFAAARARPARPGRTTPKSGPNPKSNQQSRRRRPEPTTTARRTDRDRTDRPRGDRPRGDRPERADRPRADRPRADRPRTDRPRTDRPARPKTPHAPVAAKGPERDGDRFERAATGSPKVRPSGASRRKAKREALLAAGVDPAELTRKKRRR
jgi:superfamily II DNA/RNA helicase